MASTELRRVRGVTRGTDAAAQWAVCRRRLLGSGIGVGVGVWGSRHGRTCRGYLRGSFSQLLLLLVLLLMVMVDGSMSARDAAGSGGTSTDSSGGSSGGDKEAAGKSGEVSEYHKAFPVIVPDASHTKLQVSEEGLQAIARIKNPVAIVAVIGPYRSGKSFLLNQLLSLSCNEGFGVGHARDTKTKGIWIWGEPQEVRVGTQAVSVLFMDTEGFESVGKSSVYDDRIFALAAILSSVLIYNLPETVKEADIAKLSFAVELAQEFYGRVKGRSEAFNAARLLWLIQRDFLEGKSVQEMVTAALKPVPNADGDKDVDQVNAIRNSLAVMADNSSAFGLVQPHLQRTKLCEMADSELEAKYVAQREQLKGLVQSMVQPKLVSGATINGEDFVRLLKQTLEALNKGKIPHAGSVVDTFNRAVIEKCVEAYNKAMQKFRLPVAEDKLSEGHEKAFAAAQEMFDAERFGAREIGEAIRPLKLEIDEVYEKLTKENAYESAKKCERTYAQCEDQLDYLENMRLPSMSKFDAGFARCNHTVQDACAGPSKDFYADRLKKMWTRERSQFLKEYNQRLFNWLVVSSLVLVVVGRFIIKWTVVEVLAWALFIFLETYTRIFFSMEGLYYNPAWRAFVNIWETVVFNPFIDLDLWAVPLAWCFIILLVVCRCYRFRKPSHAPLLPTHGRGSRGHQA